LIAGGLLCLLRSLIDIRKADLSVIRHTPAAAATATAAATSNAARVARGIGLVVTEQEVDASERFAGHDGLAAEKRKR
jgi:hypothetical protein